jgi:hypothetical protein
MQRLLVKEAKYLPEYGLIIVILLLGLVTIHGAKAMFISYKVKGKRCI